MTTDLDLAHEWLDEASGLAYMIMVIEQRYREAREMYHPPKKSFFGGGKEDPNAFWDNELLNSAIMQAFHYVDGPLYEEVKALRAKYGWKKP